MPQYPGQPEFKTLDRVLGEVRMLRTFPSDDELEGRRRLCLAAYARAQENPVGKGKGRQALYPQMRVTYYKMFGHSDFAKDMKAFFGLPDMADLTDGDYFMQVLEDHNVIEITMGSPRKGQHFLYPFFDEEQLTQVHDAIREKRDSSS